MNYTTQDILGIFVAFGLFSLLLLVPGFTTSFLFDLFDFRKRRPIVQAGIASLISASLSPILFFLVYRFASVFSALLLILAFLLAFTAIMVGTHFPVLLLKDISKDRSTKIGLFISLLWLIFIALFLADMQFGDRLYYNISAYDYSTRVSVIDAITRTGIPPENPSYFPGIPQPLTQVYYFWYILCSLIDRIGGALVDARTALIASVAWTGLVLFAAIALYIHMRGGQQEVATLRRKILWGIGLLSVSGLDILPAGIFILFPTLWAGRIFEGDIEHWNEQITAWIGAITWTPHHVIALLACTLAWMLTASDRPANWSRQIGNGLVSGLALASAFGLSTWITFIFIIFWVVWFVTRLVKREPLKGMWAMILPGFFMALAILPFLLDLFSGQQGDSSVGQFPLALTVRTFYPLERITLFLPAYERILLNLVALPINYFLELGFFFIVGIIWIQNRPANVATGNLLLRSEMLLFSVTVILITFVRSTVIVNNDFGWRGWMPGQFILLIWGVDIIEHLWQKNKDQSILVIQKLHAPENIRKLLKTLLIIGVITSLFDAFFMRAWPPLIDTGIAGFPRILSPDNHLGERTFAMRRAFTFIERNTPPDTIIQFDPRFTMDRPAGLYRTRGTAITYHALYGVPKQIYEPLIASVGGMFDDTRPDWESLDTTCRQYHIDILIIRDIDPIWAGLSHLSKDRKPLYENRFTAVFSCGGESH